MENIVAKGNTDSLDVPLLCVFPVMPPSRVPDDEGRFRVLSIVALFLEILKFSCAQTSAVLVWKVFHVPPSSFDSFRMRVRTVRCSGLRREYATGEMLDWSPILVFC